MKKYIHVNQGNIKGNLKTRREGRNAELQPVITIKEGKTNEYCNAVAILGPSKVIYGHDKTLLDLIQKDEQEKNEKGESITIKNNGKDVVIQRYCPHNGEDLKSACIENGVLTCSRHNWKFDLKQVKKNLLYWYNKEETNIIMEVNKWRLQTKQKF